MSYIAIIKYLGGSRVGVNIDDIIDCEMICKFYYKECELTVKKMNDIVNVGIVGLSRKGYIMEKHKTFMLNQKEFNKKILLYINVNKIGYVEEIYKKLVEEGVRNDSRIEDFREY